MCWQCSERILTSNVRHLFNQFCCERGSSDQKSFTALAFPSSQTLIAHSWLQKGSYVESAKTLAELQQGAAATCEEAERERAVKRVIKRVLKTWTRKEYFLRCDVSVKMMMLRSIQVCSHNERPYNWGVSGCGSSQWLLQLLSSCSLSGRRRLRSEWVIMTQQGEPTACTPLRAEGGMWKKLEEEWQGEWRGEWSLCAEEKAVRGCADARCLIRQCLTGRGSSPRRGLHEATSQQSQSH